MKYTNLSSLQNAYPSSDNYTVSPLGNAVLQGFYPKNKLEFPLINISDLTVIEDTTFRFIVSISESNLDTTPLILLVSSGLYNDLLRAQAEPNPYFLNTALNPNTFASIFLSDLKTIFDNQQKLESELNIKLDVNVLFVGGIPDYNRLGKYIDFIVTPPNVNDIGTDGVIPVNEISSVNSIIVNGARNVSVINDNLLA